MSRRSEREGERERSGYCHMPVGLVAQGEGQSLLLLLQCRPKIGEHSGHDTKTGLM